jgi:hypothetical protein
MVSVTLWSAQTKCDSSACFDVELSPPKRGAAAMSEEYTIKSLTLYDQRRQPRPLVSAQETLHLP